MNQKDFIKQCHSKRQNVSPPVALQEGMCAPGVDSVSSCYSKDQLLQIVKAYNVSHVDKIDGRGSKKELWDRISQKMISRCNGENVQTCLLKQNFINGELLNEFQQKVFKPKAPKGQRAWLSTSDIFAVLKQYEYTYPEFAFLGTVPMDFCTITPNGGVCGVNLKIAYSKGKHKLGAVFNTDPSHKPGQHWVSMFIDLDIKEIAYYDSFGKIPLTPEIIHLIDALRQQEKTIPGPPFKVRVNTCRHQQMNTECGVYSINFIVERLLGKSWEKIMDEQLLDSQINARRKYFFRPS